ncbi:DNA-directed RNA polymerase subunit H [Candidatus Pacearchaeota archaeon]|nr:DNA-directed RNA polymerase subunit H [Candidatus Pacearchaeota archaeon]
MHALQPKHIRLKQDELKKVLNKYNISLSQLPKIRLDDSALPENCAVGDIIKIERKEGEKTVMYYRVVVS